MANIKVKDLTTVNTINDNAKLMALTDTATNAVNTITVGDIKNVVIEPEITNITGDLANLTTTDKSNLVAAINEAAQTGSGGGASRNIGEIVMSTIPLTDAGLHLLDGSLLAYGSYQAFIDYIADLYDSGDYTEIFETEANWQTSVTNYGVCGKFVYDRVNNTVRLPKYSNKIYTSSISSTAPVKGNGMTLGLTNGTNNFGIYASNGALQANTGTTYGSNVGSTRDSSGTAADGLKTLGITTDDTKSGIISDLANITTSLDGYYYIVIATSTKTQIQVDIDQIATDLNGKADVDLTNCTKPHITETYSNGTEGYRVWSDGYCEQWGFMSGVNFTTLIFLKPFANLNYNFLATPNHYNANQGTPIACWYNKTLTTITLQTRWNGSATSIDCCWKASGYIS